MAGTKYIFVTGGVTSSLGKGIISASLGLLLQARGLRVTIQKFDPYLNVDPGTMSPYEHGECFVTEDGAETDLDLGHYERFLDIRTSLDNNVTTGRIYYDLITKERRGDFLGKTVQVIPHVTDEIKSHIYKLGTGEYDVIITEIGGCVGDIESQPFIEAIRQVRLEQGPTQVLFAHLTLVPYLKASGELKTKPTQQSIKELLSLGIQPDILLCRCSYALPKVLREKIALHCNLSLEDVIEAIDASNIYEVPLLMQQEALDLRVLTKLQLPNTQEPDLKHWHCFLKNLASPTQQIKIAVVGKYATLKDAYISIQEALVHASASAGCEIIMHWLHAEELQEDTSALANMQGIIVAPGFGSRGVEGKIQAAKYARENNIPFLGICLGMQCAVIEFARNVLLLPAAGSTEFDKNTPDPVIDLMAEQKKQATLGATMRLGAYSCQISDKSLAYKIYQQHSIQGRHRHRYELSNKYLKDLHAAGMHATGTNPETGLVEIIEIPTHPWFIGCQFHPEYESTVRNPSPLFISFVHHVANMTHKQPLSQV